MILSITTPARGFTLPLAGLVWLFDSRLEITGSLPPPAGHNAARTTDTCPGCTDLFILTYSGKYERHENQATCSSLLFWMRHALKPFQVPLATSTHKVNNWRGRYQRTIAFSRNRAYILGQGGRAWRLPAAKQFENCIFTCCEI
jgi:hypothetical protein